MPKKALPEICAAYGGSSTRVILKRAILVYGTTGDANANIVTVHDVANPEGRTPVIQPGKCATPEAVEELNRALTGEGAKRRDTLQFLNPFILAISPTRIIWHCPPSIQTLWFAPATSREDAGLKKVSGEDFPQPHLVFLTAQGAGLSVFAVKPKKGRPTPDDPIFQAPYWNLNSDGKLCMGSANTPHRPTPEAAPDYEKAFFQSNFSHPSVNGRLVNFPGGHNALWISLLGKREFPNKALLPLRGRTLRSVL